MRSQISNYEELYYQIFNKNKSVKLVIDPDDGRIIMANQAAEIFYGYSKEKLSTMTIMDINTLSDQEIEKEMALAKSEKRDFFNFRHKLASGELRDVEVYSGPITWKDKTVLYSIIHDISQTKASDARWQFAINGSGLGIFEWKPQTNEIFFSPMWKSMLGYTDQEIKNDFQEWDKRLHPDDRDNVYKDIERHLNGETDFYSNEHRLMCKDGTYKWILAKGKIISYTEDNKPETFIGTHTDISENKALIDSIIRSRSYLHSIIENRNESVWSIDNDFNFTLFNQYFFDAFKKYYNISIKKGMNALDMLDAEAQAFWKEKYELVLKGQKQNFEYFERGLFYQVRLNPIIIDTDIVGISAFSLDISDRKEQENSLLKNQQTLKTFASNINGVAFLLDQDGIFQLSEGKGLADLGLSPGQVVGLSAFDVYKDNPQIVSELHTVFQGKIVKSILDMGAIIFDINYTPVIDDTGKVTGVVGLANNITERVKAQRDLEKSQEELHQAEKMQAIGQLAGGIAHDFNNQLAGILGFADLLKLEMEDQPELIELIDNIILASQRSSDLTSQLLAFARKGKYRSDNINIKNIINEIVYILKHSIDKKITVIQDLHASNIQVKGDPSQIQNALMNVALNARDAMIDGGQLEISTKNIQIDENFNTKLPIPIKPGRFIQISISDNGIGMDEETKKRIFEPFFTTKSPGKGTGMGLAAVWGTIKIHDGTIMVDSELGRGTKIHIFLPVFEGVVKEQVHLENAISNNTFTGHILLIDDEPLIRESAKKLLEKSGFSVTELENGGDAVDYFKKHWREVDIVILDMIMPKMNGHETFLKMKKIDPNVSVILSSGYSMDGAARKILKDGAKYFLQKPFRVKELLQVVSEVLSSD